MIFFNWWIL